MENQGARSWAAVAAALLVSGCAAQPVPLVNITGRGEQWVWPFFIDGRPTVIAFWNTDEMQCLRDVPALKAFDARESSVELVTVVTGRDRYEIDQWLRRHRIRYTVLLDLEEKLARQLGVRSYPTFVYFDSNGKEIARVEDIRLVHNWFDNPRWLERAGAPPPETYRAGG
ncbi:MAG: TlpA family protein disulfide reductase [Planctomycetota bacterium]